jgi:2Fe-2S ferredoxin
MLIHFIRSDGAEFEAETRVGETVMSTAIEQGVDGILAECGGACACATCHVYVEEAWRAKVGDAGDVESSMLDYTLAPREDGSRLSCQITLTEDMDGLVVRLPDGQ